VDRFGSERPSLLDCPSCKNREAPYLFLGKPLPGEQIEAALKSHIDRLEKLFRKEASFLGKREKDSWAIGAQIHDRYGLEGMSYVCDKVRDRIGSGAARSLEMSWDGIGEWMG
jgi:hypothetical protein